MERFPTSAVLKLEELKRDMFVSSSLGERLSCQWCLPSTNNETFAVWSIKTPAFLKKYKSNQDSTSVRISHNE
jgi:hypothetical protein